MIIIFWVVYIMIIYIKYNFYLLSHISESSLKNHIKIPTKKYTVVRILQINKEKEAYKIYI